jgi:hypothetical protein
VKPFNEIAFNPAFVAYSMAHANPSYLQKKLT